MKKQSSSERRDHYKTLVHLGYIIMKRPGRWYVILPFIIKPPVPSSSEIDSLLNA